MTECIDLGILRTTDFDYMKHIDKSCLKASRLSAMLSRAFSLRDRNAQMRLFGAFVRLLIEYASSVLSPLEVGLTSQIERVQCRFTRKLFGQVAQDYDMRLRELGVL